MIEIDARRLLCPLPVIRLQNQIKSLDHNSQIAIRCTDPGVLHDIPTWCRLHGHQILKTQELDHEYYFEVLVCKPT